jgi:hypothetical protein
MLAETGVDLELLARNTGLSADTVQDILQAADGARPLMAMSPR